MQPEINTGPNSACRPPRLVKEIFMSKKILLTGCLGQIGTELYHGSDA